MPLRDLRAALAAFVEEAAWHLSADLDAGAEIPFELVEQGRASAPLYCYAPRTDRFIAGRLGTLRRMPSYPAAAKALEPHHDRLGAYLKAHPAADEQAAARTARERADAVLQALLGEVWAGAEQLTYDPQRFDRAWEGLEHVLQDGATAADGEAVVACLVDGLAIEGDEVALGGGLSLCRAALFADQAPPGVELDATLAVVRSGEANLAGAARRLRRLQTALRLWEGAVAGLAPLAWLRCTGVTTAWEPVALAAATRPAAGGDAPVLLRAEDEDQFRAFCSLVARRTPRSGPTAWALRRYESGRERPTALDGLSDWLLAARALVEPEGPASGLLADRLAALLAEPMGFDAVAGRIAAAAHLERAAIAGTVRPDDEVEALVEELGNHVRAILRDVLCGHLPPELVPLAESRLADAEAVAEEHAP